MHRAESGVPASDWFSIANIWLSLYLDFFPQNLLRVVYEKILLFRKLTKTKGGFPNENSLVKLLYLGIQNASKKWTMPIQS